MAGVAARGSLGLRPGPGPGPAAEAGAVPRRVAGPPGGGQAQAQAPAPAPAQAEEINDEFTAPKAKQLHLERNKAAIEELFRVTMSTSSPKSVLHFLADSPGSAQIWVQLRGRRERVQKAKEYIKGICNPEFRTVENYPKDMHCIFAGAKGLFRNFLVKYTCADISLEDIGVIAIAGNMEAVIMAKTRIQQFAKLFKDNQSLSSKKESSIKRKFKQFVEVHADKYTMDLLLLPSSVKEELMNLAQDAHHLEGNIEFEDLTLEFEDSSQNPCSEIKGKDLALFEEARKQAGTPVSDLAQRMDSMLTPDSKNAFGSETEQTFCREFDTGKERLPCKRRSSGSEDRHTKRQFSGEVNDFVYKPPTQLTSNELVTDCDETYDIPIKWGQDGQSEEDIIPTTPEKEFNMLVDFFRTMGYSTDIIKKVINEMGQTEEPMLLLKQIVEESNTLETYQDDAIYQKSHPGSSRIPAPRIPDSAHMEKSQDFATQIDEDKVNKPDIIPKVGHSPDQRKNEMLKENCLPLGVLASSSQNNSISKLPSEKSDTVRLVNNRLQNDIQNSQPAMNFFSFEKLLNEQGPRNESEIVARGSSEQMQISYYPNMMPFQQPAISSSSQQKGSLVTGVQRFNNLLKTPYKLTLTSDAGKTDLKHIIIDGSNVAMAHGMKKLFSCRGIAIAVEYFWNRGHRNITVFVPQWRTKRDPKITEQHFLTELEDLGVLSLTPARTVCGVRIASHDDRFLLHLAEKTEGIIVTNDNLKEFVSESPTWRAIIKDRLLQYTFVGDIFMIPDDPLGRNGPGLDVFLYQNPYRPQPKKLIAIHGQNLPFGIKQPDNWVSQNRPPPLPPFRSVEETERLKEELLKIFPDFKQRQKIDQILRAHPYMRDLNALSAMVLDQE
ncbi:NEDD4-binding protein 1 [Callorhinchus milii]|uniref:NEDD4-binding protein 1 n=1 Tax=Callorhinchus milii TaxID=7868 RepID=UPI001C3F5B1A|nr:NEDD4-binding protein 1 [Callorhinchus milii]